MLLINVRYNNKNYFKPDFQSFGKYAIENFVVSQKQWRCKRHNRCPVIITLLVSWHETGSYCRSSAMWIALHWFQWPLRLRCGFTQGLLLGLMLQIPPGAWMSVSCECCVLSGRHLCDWPITRPEESYRVWCVWVSSRNLIRGGLDQQRMSSRDNIYIFIFLLWLLVYGWFCFCYVFSSLFLNEFIFRLAREFFIFSSFFPKY
jgi:hypothetical protein